ncbi:MAG: hypothetical protein HYS13_24610 [Planctomycetia bacterium]|nr:hypothetical protein [Planctomycetia bacterium]
MTSLSIVLPMQGNVDLLESGLVSVLENRPADCEIVVVLNGPYDDPYHLEGEVRFLHAPNGASFVQSANLGVGQSRAEIVHLLSSGVQATEAWTDAALSHFDDPKVAAVAPLVTHVYKPARVLAAGVSYCAGGRRVVPAGKADRFARRKAADVLGPSCLAGFYRNGAWTAAGGMDETVGDQMADVDLALRLRALGFRSVLEPASIVRDNVRVRSRVSPIERGRQAETLFLRSAPLAGWAKSLLLHPFSLAAEALSAPRELPVRPLVLLGRLLAYAKLGEVRDHHRRLALAIRKAALPAGARLDAPHALAQPAREPSAARSAMAGP